MARKLLYEKLLYGSVEISNEDVANVEKEYEE